MNFSEISKTGILKLLKSKTDVVLEISRLETLDGIGIVGPLVLIVEFVATKAGVWETWIGTWTWGIWTEIWGTWTDVLFLLR